MYFLGILYDTKSQARSQARRTSQSSKLFKKKNHPSQPPKLTPSNPPAFNLIEIFCLILPFEWWISTARYERLNNYVMGFLYSPLLLMTAWLETKHEDTTEEWEQSASEMDFEGEGWAKKVESTRPNVETDAAVLEIREVMEKVEALTRMVEELKKGRGVEDGK